MSRPPPKPWPMPWVMLAIVTGLIAYTWFTLHYRKPGRAYRPYEDSQSRATVTRLLNAGWQLIPTEVARPSEAARATELPVHPAAPVGTRGGLPGELDYALAEKPLLPARILSVSAPREIAAGGAGRIYFTCFNDDLTTRLGEVLLLRKNHELCLIPRFERVPGGLVARWKETAAWISFPAGSLKPGRYHATLAGAAVSQSWDFAVR